MKTKARKAEMKQENNLEEMYKQFFKNENSFVPPPSHSNEQVEYQVTPYQVIRTYVTYGAYEDPI